MPQQSPFLRFTALDQNGWVVCRVVDYPVEPSRRNDQTVERVVRACAPLGACLVEVREDGTDTVLLPVSAELNITGLDWPWPRPDYPERVFSFGDRGLRVDASYLEYARQQLLESLQKQA